MQIYINKSKTMLFIIFIIMIIDYLLTFAGINYFNCISEANPLMRSIFDYNLQAGLLHRIIQSIIPVLILYYAVARKFKPIYYKLIKITLILELAVLTLHANWIIKYFIFLY